MVLDCIFFFYKIVRFGFIIVVMIIEIFLNSIVYVDYNDIEQLIVLGMKYKYYLFNILFIIIIDIESKIGNDGKDWFFIVFIVLSNKVVFILSEV